VGEYLPSITGRRRRCADALSYAAFTARVYALDSTTIDLCLSLFDWAPFRSTKAAIKLHTLLDLRGSIPAFIHISRRQAARRERVGRPARGGGCFLCDGSRLRRLRASLRDATETEQFKHTEAKKLSSMVCCD
jgi:hypothetical protein